VVKGSGGTKLEVMKTPMIEMLKASRGVGNGRGIPLPS